MFSHTDDAIVTSSPTGRHLSTVIRRPAAIGPRDWSEHADQVCKVLNELDSKAKASSLSLEPGVQAAGRPKREVYIEEAHVGNNFENQFGGESDRVLQLETELHKARMALKEPIEVPQAVISALAIPGNSAPVHGNGRTFKRGE